MTLYGEGNAGFLDLLDLEPIEVNIFRGMTMKGIPRTRVFGGQVAAQALVAAGRTVTVGRVHSLHAYFLRPGDPTVPILFEVDRIRDGRSFTTRRVVAIQHGEAIFNLHCSFHVDEPGFRHADAMPIVPPPEEIPTLEDVGSGSTGQLPLQFPDGSGLDVRYLDGPPWLREKKPADQEQIWIRSTEPLPDDPLIHAAACTYASDISLVGTILRHHPEEWQSDGFRASLDHCMWFHRPFRFDEWLFYDQVSPIAYGGRGLATAKMFTRDGTLVVSVAQEGLRASRPATMNISFVIGFGAFLVALLVLFVCVVRFTHRLNSEQKIGSKEKNSSPEGKP